MTRTLRSIVALVGMLVAFLGFAPVDLEAQMPPLVTITPHSAFDETAPYSVYASVKICEQWGGSGIVSREFKLSTTMGYVDISSAFSQTGSGNDPECDSSEIWTGTVTLSDSPSVQYLRVSVLDEGSERRDRTAFEFVLGAASAC